MQHLVLASIKKSAQTYGKFNIAAQPMERQVGVTAA